MSYDNISPRFLKSDPSIFFLSPEPDIFTMSDRKELTDNSKITLIKKYKTVDIKNDTKTFPDPNIVFPVNIKKKNNINDAELDLKTVDSDTYFTISASRKDIDIVEEKLKNDLKSNMYHNIFNDPNFASIDSTGLRMKLSEQINNYNYKMRELEDHINYFDEKANYDKVPGLLLTGYFLSKYVNVRRGEEHSLIKEGRDLWRRILCKNTEVEFKEDAIKYISLKKDLIDIDTLIKDIIDTLKEKLGKKKVFVKLMDRLRKKKLSIKDLYNKPALRKLVASYGIKEFDVREHDEPKAINIGFGSEHDYIFDRRG